MNCFHMRTNIHMFVHITRMKCSSPSTRVRKTASRATNGEANAATNDEANMWLLCRLYTLTECIWRELPETRLDECYSLHSRRELSILAGDTRRQPGKTRDPLTRAHRLLKKQDLNEVRHERRGYTRGSKARRVFPSTLSLLPCLGFPQQKCTAGSTLVIHLATRANV